MASNRDQERDKKELPAEPAESLSPQRRRLLKGLAASAPGIFTLYSGSAQAMNSAGRCLSSAQANFNKNTAVVTDNPQSGAYDAYCPQVALSGTQPTILVKHGNDTAWLRQVDGVWYAVKTIDITYQPSTWASDAYWTVESGVLDDPNDKLTFTSPEDSKSYVQEFDESGGTKTPIYLDSSVHSHACIDDHGDIRGVGPDQCGPYTPVSCSCWASIPVNMVQDSSTRRNWWG